MSGITYKQLFIQDQFQELSYYFDLLTDAQQSFKHEI